MSKFKKKTILITGLVLFFMSAYAYADTLTVVENQITDTTLYETAPTLGDGVVVYTARALLNNGFYDQGDIWYQPIDVTGAPVGEPVQVTSDSTDDKLNDTSGDYIVYTAYDTVDTYSGQIMLYQISTGTMQPIGDALVIQEPRIHGDVVVWVQGSIGASEVMKYDLAWIGTATTPESLTGPIPPTSNVDIGDRFVVWVEMELMGDADIGAYDLINNYRIKLTDTAAIDERHPSTSGDWIVWESQNHGATAKRIEAANLETGDYRIIHDDGSVGAHPSMYGDLIAFESNAKGNYDIFLYRISTEETFTVTMDPDDQYLNDIYDDKVAYVDIRNQDEDVWIASLTFDAPGVPDIEVSPTEYNFGDVELGSSTTTIVTISNEGGADLALSDISFQAGSCVDFSITSYTLFEPDQINEYHTGTSFQCGAPPVGQGSLFQSFTPTASFLSGVDLLLRAGGSFPVEGYNTTINLRSNDPQGVILGTATTFVPGPLTPGSQQMVHFSFTEEIPLIPGQTYIIEWISPLEGGDVFGWMGSDTNPYPSGTAFGCYGTAVVNNDFVFMTYRITSPSSLGVVVSNGSLDIEVTYSPSDAGVCSGTLEIASNDPDESPVEVSLNGNGVIVEVPPHEQIANILDSIAGWVADGLLTGQGRGNSGPNRLNAFINMIEAAGDLIEAGDIEGACDQLMAAYRKCDGETRPPDFVAGKAREDLAQMLLDLMASLGC